ncbi:hypothetical protein PR003_g22866 [Phytophthora rubi]|uniref:Pectate lyase n=1 Tax=Phytophthora rubi TaxID=129364 RepID=A0A6A3MZI9_9STRA|nr:hypothetical protein PR002_g24623 [Phytophthora rubi]KAE9034180.1 hypothetical protein PR001_g9851 [Phytophthora rubi]KAE9299948.1 hypothetical protein PR003_g22866 [Phytophthora rubi]
MSYGIIVFVLNVIAVQGDTDTCTNVWTSSGKEQGNGSARWNDHYRLLIWST